MEAEPEKSMTKQHEVGWVAIVIFSIWMLFTNIQLSELISVLRRIANK